MFFRDLIGSVDQHHSDDWNANDDKMMVDDGDRDEYGHGHANDDGDGVVGVGDDDDDDDDDDVEFDFLQDYLGNGWEPDVRHQGSVDDPDEMEDDLPLEDNNPQSLPAKFVAGMQLCSEPVVVKFPNPNAGASIGADGNSGYHDYQSKVKNSESPWAPFKSRMEWDIARWAKIRGPGSTAFDELMQIQGVSYNIVYAIFT